MALSQELNDMYVAILKEELIPSLGCTEPVSLALGAATARHYLGSLPDRVEIHCSGNLIKNVMGVTVPNSGGMKGILASVALGIVGGDSEKGLEVLSGLNPSHIEVTKEFLRNTPSEMHLLESAAKLHHIVKVFSGARYALVEIMHQHNNIVRIELDGVVMLDRSGLDVPVERPLTDRSRMNVADIVEFSNTVDSSEVTELIERQIQYNTSISKEGLSHPYGANVGASILKHSSNANVGTRAKAAAAAGSDARMSGCDLPVIINSGSGNQGMAVSLPVIEFAHDLKISHERLVRALVCSNLVAIHQKTGMGPLSAFCGVVTAACGSGAGITYLCGGTLDQINETITNTIGTTSGILCDGAKPSCAAKIASAVDAAITAHYLAVDRSNFLPGEGIIKDDVEKTIAAIGRIVSEGMIETDKKILDEMRNTRARHENDKR